MNTPEKHLAMPIRLRAAAIHGGRRPRTEHAGYLYVAVLFAALIVTMSVTALITTSTSRITASVNSTASDQAVRLAESEVHRLAVVMSADRNWRSTRPHGSFSELMPFSLDGQSAGNHKRVRHLLRDSDGILSDDPWDSIDVIVEARVGKSKAAVGATFEPDPKPLELLRNSITAFGNLKIENTAFVSCERDVVVTGDGLCANIGALSAPSISCDGNIEFSLRGERNTSSISMPDSGIVERYAALGTEIPLSSLPGSSLEKQIFNCGISASSNPFGPTDPNGVYWIDAKGAHLTIGFCRIEATVAILNAKWIYLTGGVAWTFPNAADVILAANSPIYFWNMESSISEDDRGINLNPPSFPNATGQSNLSSLDHYATELRGVIFSTSHIHFLESQADVMLPIRGSVIGRDISFLSSVSISQLDELLTSFPPGLCDPTNLRFTNGSLRRVATE